MPRLAVFFVFCFSLLCAAAFSQSRGISGTFVSLEKNWLTLQTSPQVSERFKMGAGVKVVSLDGNSFPVSWFYPGDGIEVSTGKDGTAKKIEAGVRWFYGAAAFASKDRITLRQGLQVFLSGAPVFLNGIQVKDASFVKPGMEVLIRFNEMGELAAGVWAFDFDDNKSGSFSVRESRIVKKGKDFLRLEVSAPAQAKLHAEILGVSDSVQLKGDSQGNFAGTFPIPQGMAIPGAYFKIERELTSGKTEAYIPRVRVSLYSVPPQLESVQPDNAVEIVHNPPFIFAQFNSDKSPVDPDSIRLVLDGENIAGTCYHDSYLIFCAPEKLAPGKHLCDLAVRGQGEPGRIRKKWWFIVGR